MSEICDRVSIGVVLTRSPDCEERRGECNGASQASYYRGKLCEIEW